MKFRGFPNITKCVNTPKKQWYSLQIGELLCKGNYKLVISFIFICSAQCTTTGLKSSGIATLDTLGECVSVKLRKSIGIHWAESADYWLECMVE